MEDFRASDSNAAHQDALRGRGGERARGPAEQCEGIETTTKSHARLAHSISAKALP